MHGGGPETIVGDLLWFLACSGVAATWMYRIVRRREPLWNRISIGICCWLFAAGGRYFGLIELTFILIQTDAVGSAASSTAEIKTRVE